MNVLRYTIEDLFCIDCVATLVHFAGFFDWKAVKDSCKTQHFVIHYYSRDSDGNMFFNLSMSKDRNAGIGSCCCLIFCDPVVSPRRRW